MDTSPLKNDCLVDYLVYFETLFSRDEFEEVISATQCYYCETTKEEFDQLYNEHKVYKKAARGWKLELDRKNANYEYSKDNCVMACYWCNNAKTDEFNAKEFKSIGMKIGKALMARLAE